MKKKLIYLAAVMVVFMCFFTYQVKAESVGNVVKTDKAESVGNVVNTDKAEGAGNAVNTDKAENTDKSGNADKAGNKDKEESVNAADISIDKEERSFTLEEEDFDREAVFSYEKALLPQTVKNHEKINKDIEEKAERFFEDYETWYENDEYMEGAVKLYCGAEVKSVYLDENYYSVNVEKYTYAEFESWTDRSDANTEFIGYTYDLKTGEEAEIEEVLSKDDKELSKTLYDTVIRYIPDKAGDEDFPSDEEFSEDENYGEFNYCIVMDGWVYILYDAQNTDLARSCAFCAEKYGNKDHKIEVSEMMQMNSGLWYTVTDDEIEDIRKTLNVKKRSVAERRYQVPYMKDGSWYVPILFTQDYSEIVYASAEVSVDDRTDFKDTTVKKEEMYGEWYSTNLITDKKNKESIPESCFMIYENFIDVYDYDKDSQSYVKSETRDLYSSGITLSGFYAEELLDTSCYKSAEDDIYMMERYDVYEQLDAPDPISETLDESGTIISPKSEHFKDYFETDCTKIKKTGEKSVSKALDAPKVNDGVLLYDPDAVRVHFTWDKVEGADGYIVSIQRSYFDIFPDEYSEPCYEMCIDHYYVDGAQEYINFKVRVRAFKTDGDCRIYSEWSEYATGSTYEEDEFDTAFDPTIKNDTASYEKYYGPELTEFVRAFNKDESVYGLRIPMDFYVTVDESFSTLDIKDTYYTFYDLSPGYYDEYKNLIIFKKTDKGDFVYTVYDGHSAMVSPLPVVKNEEEGEGYYLFDNGIIGYAESKDGYESISYYKASLPAWGFDLIGAVVKAVDNEGKTEHYKYENTEESTRYEASYEKSPRIFEKITEKEYNEIRSKYEKPADIERLPLADFK
ncbi:MAG: hypothetical protein K6B28_13365 [Lachnospiraceae bacterium]|nr:hypothetical protein [Lachnospiraceae bacterium]